MVLSYKERAKIEALLEKTNFETSKKSLNNLSIRHYLSKNLSLALQDYNKTARAIKLEGKIDQKYRNLAGGRLARDKTTNERLINKKGLVCSSSDFNDPDGLQIVEYKFYTNELDQYLNFDVRGDKNFGSKGRKFKNKLRKKSFEGVVNDGIRYSNIRTEGGFKQVIYKENDIEDQDKDLLRSYVNMYNCCRKIIKKKSGKMQKNYCKNRRH